MVIDKKNDPLKYDNRLTERFIERGKLTQKEYDQYLEKLPDLSDKYEDVADEIYSLLDKKSDKEKFTKEKD